MSTPVSTPAPEDGDLRRHVFSVNSSERCMFCGVNIYDQSLYGPDDDSDCIDRAPMVYTSETPLSETPLLPTR